MPKIIQHKQKHPHQSQFQQQKSAIDDLMNEGLLKTFYIQDWATHKTNTTNLISQNMQHKQQSRAKIDCLDLNFIINKKNNNNNKVKHSSLKRIKKQSYQSAQEGVSHKNDFVNKSNYRYLDAYCPVPNKIYSKKSLFNSQMQHSDKLTHKNSLNTQKSTKKLIQSQKKLPQDAFDHHMQKIRKMSLPWLKFVPRTHKREHHDKQELLNDQYIYKIKKIKSSRHKRQQLRCSQKITSNIMSEVDQDKSMHKNGIYPELNKICRQLRIKQGQQDSIVSNNDDKKRIQLLKKWMQMNQSGDHKRMASLLRQHFASKAQENKQKNKHLKGLILRENALRSNRQQKLC